MPLSREKTGFHKTPEKQGFSGNPGAEDCTQFNLYYFIKNFAVIYYDKGDNPREGHGKCFALCVYVFFKNTCKGRSK
jgi:hypothetical protein